MSQTISSAISWWSRMQPDNVALCVEGRSATYRQFDDWASRVAKMLIAEGVQPGDRVSVCANASLEFGALAYGAMRAGAILFPMNTRFTAHESAEVLEDTAPKLLFIDENQRAKLEPLGVPLRSLPDIAGLREGPREVPPIDLNPDMPICIIATSGSTARPKGVIYSHRSMIGYVSEFSIEEPEIAKGASVLGVAPMSTAGGYVQLCHYLILGCSLYLESVFEPKMMLDLILEKKIAAFGGVPVLFERVASLPEFADADLSCLKLCTVGGARVQRALLDTWNNKGVVLRQIYGQTEAGGNSTIMPRHLALEQPDKCGWGGIFTDHRIIREDGSPCDPGEVGQILIRGPGVMLGYWNNPKATAETLKDGWLYTGDLGVMDEDGLLTFVDRLKDLIISGGMNISAAEVERAVADFPGVIEVVVIAAPDEKFGETPMAVLHASCEIDVAELIAHCNVRLANYKVPRYVVVEPEPLPRVPNGKLHKPVVREKYKDVSNLPRVR